MLKVLSSLLLPYLALLTLASPALATTDATGCIEHIRNVLSLKNFEPSNPEIEQEKYAAAINETGIHLDKKLRAYLCKVDSIVIDDSFQAAGAAQRHTEGNKDELQITLTPKTFSETDLSTYFYKKTNKLFQNGDSNPPLNVRLNIPSVSNALLLYVLTHELAHIYDYDNQIVQFSESCFIDSKQRPFHCTATSPFTEISWSHDDAIRHPTYYGTLEASRLSQYGLVLLNPELAKYLLDEFAESSFPTIYGGKNASEDFAESATLFFLSRDFHDFQFTYELTKNQTSFDVVEHWKSDQLKKKRDLVSRILGN